MEAMLKSLQQVMESVGGATVDDGDDFSQEAFQKMMKEAGIDLPGQKP